MNAIVKLALDRPYTVAVLAVLIALFGGLSVVEMPVDIFPRINVPVISMIFQFSGLMPRDMEQRVVSLTERASTTTVNGIQHIESTCLLGTGLIKIYLHQDADQAESIAEANSIAQAILKQMPPGMTPPFITAFSATDVPVMQLSLSSKTLPETKLFDFANNFIRQQLATVQGASMPYPYGGALRQVTVDIDPAKLAAKNVSAADVSNAINAQNIILPAGTAKMGTYEYYVQLNSSPTAIDELNNLPVKQVNGATVLVRDVAYVHDGLQVQTNVVNENGSRAIIMNILRLGGASTVDVVNRVKAQLPSVRQILPDGCDLRILTDQSIFVKDAVNDVIKEGATAAALTALLMLLLLGDWESTVIVAVSIPLSVLAGLICLHLAGQTLNTLTLGGFALAVGMLVDDATVEVENIHRHLHTVGSGVEQLRKAILDAAAEIATPAFVSTVSICIVFAPTVLLMEPAKSLFVPLAMAVCASMMSSYFLSRTVVPVMARYMLKTHADAVLSPKKSSAFGAAFNNLKDKVDDGFNFLRDTYARLLKSVMSMRPLVACGVVTFMLVSICLVPVLGRDFFPTVDSGVIRMHVSAPRGMRIEETEIEIKRIESVVRTLVPADEFETIADNIGIPNSGINLSSSDSVDYTAADGEIITRLKPDHKHSVAFYQREFRNILPQKFPECSFFFQPADISTQILNAGLAAPIDVQVRGLNLYTNYAIAQELQQKIGKIPGAVDVHIKQAINGPVLNVDIDRNKASQLGITQRDVAGSVLTELSGSFQTAPNFWVNPKNGVNYQLAVQTPQRQISSVDDLSNTVVTSGSHEQLLGNLAKFGRGSAPTLINHYNSQPVVDVLASVDGTDLGSVAAQVQKIVDSYKAKLPKGVFLDVRGQVVSMNTAFSGLIEGIGFALILVYLLLVVNFQSWSDPFIILMAIPGAMCGVVWALFLTQTTFSVPALMGCIMTIGVASANSILVVSFARERLHEGKTALESAMLAGTTRFRPVLMTAAAMIIGMLPMALGTGAGGAQNAPLGRAVIGGLLVATFFTLIWVPLVFSFIHRGHKGGKHTGIPAEHPEVSENIAPAI